MELYGIYHRTGSLAPSTAAASADDKQALLAPDGKEEKTIAANNAPDVLFKAIKDGDIKQIDVVCSQHQNLANTAFPGGHDLRNSVNKCFAGESIIWTNLTPLMLTMKNGGGDKTATVQLLLRYGANPNIASTNTMRFLQSPAGPQTEQITPLRDSNCCSGSPLKAMMHLALAEDAAAQQPDNENAINQHILDAMRQDMNIVQSYSAKSISGGYRGNNAAAGEVSRCLLVLAPPAPTTCCCTLM
jgi:hypothetical protein